MTAADVLAILRTAGEESNERGKEADSPDGLRRAVLRPLEDEEREKGSDREGARRCAVDNSTASRMRHEISLLQSNSDTCSYTTKHGTGAVMQTGNIGKGKA
jgi:hypothetical protein